MYNKGILQFHALGEPAVKRERATIYRIAHHKLSSVQVNYFSRLINFPEIPGEWTVGELSEKVCNLSM